jgi:hypothetical protein
MERFKQLAGIINEVEVKTTKATDLQFILRDLADAYGEQIGNDLTKDDFKNYTVGQIIDDWKRLKGSIKELANIPSDVKNLGVAQTKATTVQNKAKMINNITEFPGAFENWFNTLGFEPGKVSKSAIRSAVEKSLTNLGYK